MNTKGKHIAIVSQAHLCRNPRVYKEAVTLYNAGYYVTIITSIYDQNYLREDIELLKNTGIKYKFVSDLRSKSFKNYYDRLVKALSIKLKQWFAIELPSSLGYNLNGYYNLLKKSKADLFIVHQELPLYIGCRLVKQGKKVGFDFEDWYSEDLLPESRNNRPLKLLKRAEEYALKNGTYVQTTSHALANALAKTYNTNKPFVIYNTFNASDTSITYKDRKDLTTPSLYWFSQTIGPGRGIETIIEALKIIKTPVQLHLRGQSSVLYDAFLLNLLGTDTPHQLYIHPLLPNNELDARIKEHDIGLALEYYEPPNKDLTISNKIFHYLVNEIPVIATPTAGQYEVKALGNNCVFVTDGFSADALADTIKMLLNKPELLIQAKQLLKTLSKTINWDVEQKKMLDIITNALKK